MADMSRTDSTQAFKNILSAYGDDDVMEEDEDEEEEEESQEIFQRPEDNISNSEDDEPKPMAPSLPVKHELADESSQDNTPKKMRPSRPPPPAKLVSYGGDVDVEGSSDDDDYGVHRLVDYDESMIRESIEEEEKVTVINGSQRFSGIELPPEPTERCSNRLQEKIGRLYDKMRSGMNLNASIQDRKDFRNPSIYEKLIQYCNIDEKGTNYPPELFNTHLWGKESFYDELAKSQKADMDKREKDKKERTKVEFVTGTKKQTSEGTVIEQKRKSKWDAQTSNKVSKPVVITTTVVNPSVSSSSGSGVKTAVISATGTLKKPK